MVGMWHDTLVAGLVLMLVCWAAGFLVERRLPRTASSLRVTAAVVSRLLLCAIFVEITARAVALGGYWLLLAAVTCLLALFSVFLVAAILVVVSRDGAHWHRQRAS